MGAEFDLQKAINSVLTAGAPIAGDPPTKVVVYDDVPDNTLPPYITIGETTAADWDTDTTVGDEVTVTIHTWSMYRGYMELKNMMSAIKGLLHEQKLLAFGLNVVMVVQEFSQVMVESDGLTRHGVQRFRILMEEN